MICAQCANAADNRLDPDAHCDVQGGPGACCDCQHRTDHYGEPNRAPDNNNPNQLDTSNT